MSYCVYMVRCEDGSYYTGIAADAVRRMREHLSRSGPCARYTRVHGVVALVGLWGARDRSWAQRLEYRIKRLTRQEKEALLREPERARTLVPGACEGDFAPAGASMREVVWFEATH